MKRIIFLAVAIALSGCASTSLDYTAPEPRSITKGVLIDKSFDKVWDKLVEKLSSDFFVINNIEKESRIINVSFTTNTPEKYVTCGKTVRTLNDSDGITEVSYDPAASSSYVGVNPNGVPFNIKRNTKMTGRVNIYVAPVGGKTKIAVNSKYLLKVTQSVIEYGVPNSRTEEIDLSTSSTYIGGNGFSCNATGELERAIIAYAM